MESPGTTFSTFSYLASLAVCLVFANPTMAFAQTTGIFTPTGNMQNPRAELRATKLPSGKVLVIGGTSAVAELYDPATKTFTTTGSMAAPRYAGTATLLNTGKVLVRGGDGESLATPAELYDPSKGTFSQTGKTTQEFDAEYSTATLLNNGKVLIIGGDTQVGPAGNELYDPASGTFTALPELNRSDPNQEFRPYHHTATLLNNGKVLIAGGDNFFNGTGVTFTIAELFDPSSNTFSGPIQMITGREGHTATLLGNGRVLLSGGYFHNCCGLPDNGGFGDVGVHGSTELFDPSTNTFTRGADLNGAVFYHSATLLQNGQVLIAGGSDETSVSGSSSGTPAEALAELYDPSTGVFTNTGSLNTGRSQHAAVLLNGGTVLVAGGIDAASNPLASADLHAGASYRGGHDNRTLERRDSDRNSDNQCHSFIGGAVD